MRGAGAILLSSILLLSAQQGPEQGEIRGSTAAYRPRTGYTLAVDTRLVEIGVVVRDPKGHAVGNLTRDDFEITDDGKKRTVTAFTVETARPAAAPVPVAASAADVPAKVSQRYLGLLFDDVSMGPADLQPAQAAARRFVKEGLRAGDHVAFFTVSGSQSLPFTTDVQKLSEAIDKLHLSDREPTAGVCPNLTAYDGYVIANHLDLSAVNVKIAELARCQNQPVQADVIDWQGDTPGASRGGRSSSRAVPPNQMFLQVMGQAGAIWEQVRATSQNALYVIADVVDYMAGMPENRTILLASSGFFSTTMESQMDDITRHALHAGVVINALDAKGLFAADLSLVAKGMDARSVARMQMIGVAPKDLANDSLASLAYNTGGLFFHNSNDLTAGFNELGMRPEVTYLLGFAPDGSPDGKYHKLKVRLKTPEHNTVQARLGYMSVAHSTAADQARRIDTVAAGNTVLNEIPVGLTGRQAQAESGDHQAMAVFHIDVRQLHFTERAGTRQQQLSLVGMLLDADGRFVAGKESTVVLALKESTFARLLPEGLNLTLTLPAPAGTYNLRAVIGESIDGRISASTLPIEIR